MEQRTSSENAVRFAFLGRLVQPFLAVGVQAAAGRIARAYYIDEERSLSAGLGSLGAQATVKLLTKYAATIPGSPHTSMSNEHTRLHRVQMVLASVNFKVLSSVHFVVFPSVRVVV